MTITRNYPPSAVAVIGMAGRFPDAPDVRSFWRNLTNGVESLTPLSDDELAAVGIPASQLADPNYVKKASPMDGPHDFDASFFGVNAREAELIDPQQRVFLECAWEAIEDAGYIPDDYPGVVSVYGGSSYNTYLLTHLASNPDVLSSVGSYATMVANDKDYISTRTAYKLNLRGGSVTVQTACSTTLVAAQMAWQSLLDYQCDLAIAGGISIWHPLNVGYLYNEGMIFSPDGHVRPFDANAKGIRIGAGGGVVVLKRLEDAIADRDPIRAVILGAAINNDGSDKMGFSAPSIDGQAEVIAMAQARAEVDPETITYVEAHGTATPLGDPIEVAALTHVFRAGTSKREYCGLGSVKSNIGHLDVAAGVAGLIKTVLSLEHGMLPPSLNFEKPNPQIDFTDSPFYVNHKLTEWRTNGEPRRAGVSSFGIGGTNAHAVLEEAPPRGESVSNRPAQLLVLSARSSSALDQAAGNLATRLEEEPDLNLADVAYTLQVGRKRFDHRRAIVCHDTSEAIAELGRQGSASRARRNEEAPPVAFLFSGQGSQYAGMARHLYQADPTFREVLDQCTDILSPIVGRDMSSLILTPAAEGETSDLNQTRFAQPALFAVEYALARTWMAWGVKPAAMLGHSIGEYVAACLSGVLSLEDALKLVAERGRVMQEMPPGQMIAVPLPESDVLPLLNEALTVAAVNAPQLCVVAGPAGAIAEFEKLLSSQGIQGRILHTSHAFHSAMMDPALPEFLKALDGVTLNAPGIPFISNRTGTWATAGDVTRPSYWAEHLRHSVRFAEGVEELAKAEGMILLEVGPGKALATLVRQALGNSGHEVLASLPHPLDTKPDLDIMYHSLGRLWMAGVNVDWQGVHRDEVLYRVSLPTYPFERQRYSLPLRFGGAQAVLSPALSMDGIEGEVSMAGTPARLTKRSDIGSWFYAPSWKRLPAPEYSSLETVTQNGAWLLFVDDSGVGMRMAQQIAADQGICFTVHAGEAFGVEGNRYTVRPGDRSDYDRVISDLVDRGVVLGRIVHMWGLGDDVPELDAILEREYFSVIALLQSLVEHGVSQRISLTLMATGLHRVIGDEPLVPERGVLLGPAAVINREFHNIWPQTLDVRLSEVDDDMIETLIADTSYVSTVDNAAYRSGYKWSESFEHVTLPVATDVPHRLRKNGVYVITGGLGGLGLAVARFLARTVQARLVLIGRTPLPARDTWDAWLESHDASDATSLRIQAVREIESAGGEVLAESADVTDEASMERVAAEARARFGNIHGVFHIAGIPGGSSIALHERKHTQDVFASKIVGTTVIDKVFRKPGLDILVLFSSVNTKLGYGGTVDYSAANGFLDRYGQARNNRESPILTINWDGWQDVGMMTQFFSAEELQEAMLVEEGIEALNRILNASIPEVIVYTRDLLESVVRARRGEGSHEVQELPKGSTVGDAVRASEDNVTEVEDSHHKRPDLSQEYVAPETDQEHTIVQLWEDLLGIKGIGIDDNFFELGGHSLIATGLMARIQQQSGVRLPLRTIFEAPTARTLAERVTALTLATQTTPPLVEADSGREEFEL